MIQMTEKPKSTKIRVIKVAFCFVYSSKGNVSFTAPCARGYLVSMSMYSALWEKKLH